MIIAQLVMEMDMMMKTNDDYISRKAAEQAKCEFLGTSCHTNLYAMGWNDCNIQYRENILNILPADVRPVVYGRFVKARIGGIDHRRCTNCGCYIETTFFANDYKVNFCPNCGADMRPQGNKE